MYKNMAALTSSAQKMFEILELNFPEDDSPKNKCSRKANM
jgi:hypothetical protein